MANSFLATATAAHPVAVAVSHVDVEVPAATASVWLAALSSDQPVVSVIPGMLSDSDGDRVWRGVYSGAITTEDLAQAMYKAVAAASGRRWWEAMKLVGMCDGNQGPELVGRLTLKGVDPDAMPFARWCAALYALVVSGMDDKDRMKFDARLISPPAGIEFEDEGMSFESMVTAVRGTPGARIG